MTADLQPLFKCKYKTSADSQQELENDDCKELVKDLLSDQHLNLAHTVCTVYFNFSESPSLSLYTLFMVFSYISPFLSICYS